MLHFLHLLHPAQKLVGARGARSASRKVRMTIIAYARVGIMNHPAMRQIEKWRLMSKTRRIFFITHCVLPKRHCVMGKTWRVLPVNRHKILFQGRWNIYPKPWDNRGLKCLFNFRKLWKRAGTKPCARPLVACNRRDARKGVKTTGRGAPPVKNDSNMSPEGATERSALPPLRGWD